MGKTVTLNGRGFTVVGVATPDSRGHTTSEAYDIWVPLAMFAVADAEALRALDQPAGALDVAAMVRETLASLQHLPAARDRFYRGAWLRAVSVRSKKSAVA